MADSGGSVRDGEYREPTAEDKAAADQLASEVASMKLKFVEELHVKSPAITDEVMAAVEELRAGSLRKR